MKLHLVPRLLGRRREDSENLTRTISLIIIIWFCIWLVAGCTHAPTMDIAWREVTISEIKQICGKKIACAKWNPEQKWCQVTTVLLDDAGFAYVRAALRMESPTVTKDILKTYMAGHEFRHCFEGAFHKEEETQ